jgi:hypothetical protein
MLAETIYEGIIPLSPLILLIFMGMIAALARRGDLYSVPPLAHASAPGVGTSGLRHSQPDWSGPAYAAAIGTMGSGDAKPRILPGSTASSRREEPWASSAERDHDHLGDTRNPIGKLFIAGIVPGPHDSSCCLVPISMILTPGKSLPEFPCQRRCLHLVGKLAHRQDFPFIVIVAMVLGSLHGWATPEAAAAGASGPAGCHRPV